MIDEKTIDYIEKLIKRYDKYNPCELIRIEKMIEYFESIQQKLREKGILESNRFSNVAEPIEAKDLYFSADSKEQECEHQWGEVIKNGAKDGYKCGLCGKHSYTKEQPKESALENSILELAGRIDLVGSQLGNLQKAILDDQKTIEKLEERIKKYEKR